MLFINPNSILKQQQSYQCLKKKENPIWSTATPLCSTEYVDHIFVLSQNNLPMLIKENVTLCDTVV